MGRNTFEVFVNETEYTQYISYPIDIVEKNLDESFNTYTVTLNRMDLNEPLFPNQTARLKWLEDGTLKEEFFGMLLADAIEKIGATPKYKHVLNLIEYTYFLETVVLPDSTVTRVEGVYEPTLFDVASRLLSIAGSELGGLGINIDMDTQTLLNAVKSPEWTFTRLTLLEALRMVFGYVKIVPKMINFTTLSHIKPIQEQEDVTKTESFFNTSKAYNPQTYKTRLLSNVNNFIAGGDNASIVEPANGWLTVRSASNYEISNNDAMLHTSRPIYKVEMLEVESWFTVAAKKTGASSFIFESVPLDIIPREWFTPFPLYEKTVWDSLENTTAFGQKGASLSYVQGKTGIFNFGTVAPSEWNWFPNAQAWQQIVDYFRDTEITLNNFIKPQYRAQAQTLALDYWVSQNGAYTSAQAPIYGISFSYMDTQTASKIPEVNRVYELRFRIKYTPYIETNILTYRERKTNDSEKITTQYYNQQANVISSDVLAELHDKVSKSNTGNEVNISFLSKSYQDRIRVGYKVGDYIITSATHKVNLYGINSYYALDKFFVKLNTYVAVLEKWRQFSIPSENIVRRQISLLRFAKFSHTKSTATGNLRVANYLGDETREIQMMRLAIPQASNIVSSTSNFAFNNALIWETTMAGNATAGSRSLSNTSSQRKDQPVRYTDINGRFNGVPTITFFDKFPYDMDTNASHNLPIAPLIFAADAWFNQALAIGKDAREQLSFSLQLHHVDTTGKLYINRGFAAQNGLVGGPGLTNGLTSAHLHIKPFYQDIIDLADIASFSPASFILSDTSIFCPLPLNTSGVTSAAHAVLKPLGNDKYEVLYWVDEETRHMLYPAPIYINFSEQY